MRDSLAYLAPKRWRRASRRRDLSRDCQEATTLKMHASSSPFAVSCNARIYARDAVIPYFRIRETPNVAVATRNRAINNLWFSISKHTVASSTRGPFYHPSAPVTLARSARRHARRSVGIRLTVRLDDFASCIERTRRETKEGSERQGLHCVRSASNWSANGMWNVRLRGNAAQCAVLDAVDLCLCGTFFGFYGFVD